MKIVKINLAVMKTKVLNVVVLLVLFAAPGFPQEKTKKELKEELKLEKQKQVETMVNAKEFVFIAKTALPSGMRSVDLSTNTNFMKFQPEMIESEMPYFGKAYSGTAYGGEAGMRFKGKPEEFTVVKQKKNFQIDAVVKGNNDTFRISLSVSFEGSTSLYIISNNRSNITYQGEISPLKKAETEK